MARAHYMHRFTDTLWLRELSSLHDEQSPHLRLHHLGMRGYESTAEPAL